MIAFSMEERIDRLEGSLEEIIEIANAIKVTMATKADFKTLKRKFDSIRR